MAGGVVHGTSSRSSPTRRTWPRAAPRATWSPSGSSWRSSPSARFGYPGARTVCSPSARASLGRPTARSNYWLDLVVSTRGATVPPVTSVQRVHGDVDLPGDVDVDHVHHGPGRHHHDDPAGNDERLDGGDDLRGDGSYSIDVRDRRPHADHDVRYVDYHDACSSPPPAATGVPRPAICLSRAFVGTAGPGTTRSLARRTRRDGVTQLPSSPSRSSSENRSTQPTCRILGINTYMDLARAARGLDDGRRRVSVIAQQDEWTTAEVANDPKVVGWLVSDECDMGYGCWHHGRRQPDLQQQIVATLRNRNQGGSLRRTTATATYTIRTGRKARWTTSYRSWMSRAWTSTRTPARTSRASSSLTPP